MLNKRARQLIGYDRLVKEMVAKVDVKELDELTTGHLKAMLGEGYEAWEFKDLYRLLIDIKKTIGIATHEILTTEAIFNSLPWAAQQAAQEAVKVLIKKAEAQQLYKMDETADMAAEFLWNMFYCMKIDIKDAAQKMSRENRAYSYNDMKENKMLLEFIEEMRRIQWYTQGEVARIRSKAEM